MHIKALAAAALTVLVAGSTAFAAPHQTGKTEAGAGLFDRGGLFYNDAANTDQRSDPHAANIDPSTTASVNRTSRNYSAVPADNARNEAGLGLFDTAN